MSSTEDAPYFQEIVLLNYLQWLISDGQIVNFNDSYFKLAEGVTIRVFPEDQLASKESMENTIDWFLGEYCEKASRRDFDHSRPFDVHRWSEHPEANIFVDAIYEEFFTGGNANIRKKHLKTVLLDLYLAWREDPTLCIAIARDVNAYEPGSRYNSLKISKLTPNILDILIDVGLISQQTGWKDEGGRGFRTRIWPREPLIERFKQLDIPLIAIGHHEEKDCIILRDEKRKEIEYDDTDDTNTMREQLRAYNELISRTFIDMPTLEEAFIEMDSEDPDKPSKLYVNQSVAKKFVKRIFNRGSFEFGGRFYGGWWQNCPSYLRKSIFLNNMPTSEIDFGSMHVAMAYASAGINYFDLGIDDPYVLPEFEFFDGDQRKLVKRLMLIALNAKTDAKTYGAFRDDQPTGSPNKRLTNTQLAEVLDTLKELHEPISDFIANDAGIRFMRMDSDISNLVVSHFVEQDIPILVMHDSYSVPLLYRKELRKIMQSSYQTVMGKYKVKSEPDRNIFEETLDESMMHGIDMNFFGPENWRQDEETFESFAKGQIVIDGTTDRYIREYKQFNEHLRSKEATTE